MSKKIPAPQADMRAEDVSAALEEEIALGRLAPRQRLIEEEIAGRFGVKRHVVRQVLMDLVSMGLVIHEPNRGATVRDFPPVEVEQLYAVRTMVEGAAIELMPMPAPPAVVAELTKIQARHSAAVAARDYRQVFRANLEFHRALFAACANATLIEIVSQLAFKTHGIRSYSIGDPQILENARQEHLGIIALLQTDRRDELVALVKRHIVPAKSAYLQQSRLAMFSESSRAASRP